MKEMFFSVQNLTFLDKGPYSFSAERGECIGLTGRSGIGKTQLFRAITDLIPAGGEVLLEGVPRSTFSPTNWRSQVTMVPADSFWWFDRVSDHFHLSDRRSWLEKSCISLGLETEILGWQVSRLSTGERQRLALLRALFNRPSVLLLDEPSSGLDPYHTGLMEKYVEHYRLQNVAAIVWVSHDSEQLRRVSSRSLQMEHDGLYEKI